MTVPAPSFDHVIRLSDDIGIFEHAEWSTPRREHGYCVDDVARALLVVAREPEPVPGAADLLSRYLDFVLGALAPDGRCHNRFGTDGRWHDRPSTDDCWGRALWGLGTAAARATGAADRARATAGFRLGARRRSSHPRAMAFAGLGAAEILAVTPEDVAARDLLTDAAAAVGRPGPDPSWPWPDARLTYANAVLPEVLIAAGELLDDERQLDDGLRLLGWLLDTETQDGHLSVTPAGGWARGEARPAFDQQPIEVAAIADACVRALRVTGDARWARGVELAADWFAGDNDTETPLHDPVTGGGCDGLQRTGRNENQGAESTLALVATWQHARQLVRT